MSLYMPYINLGLFVLVLYVIYYVLERLYPALRSAHESQQTYNELYMQFGKMFNKAIYGFLVVVVVSTVLFRYLIYLALALRLTWLDDVIVVIPPPAFVQWLLAFAFALVAGFYLLSNYLYYAVLQSWETFLYFVTEHLRFDVVFYLTKLRRITFFTLFVFTYLTFDCFTTFGEEEIKVNDFIGIGTAKYGYDYINELLVVDAGADVWSDAFDMPYYAIRFKDGNHWNSLIQGFPSFEQNQPIITNYVLPKYNGKITRVSP